MSDFDFYPMMDEHARPSLVGLINATATSLLSENPMAACIGSGTFVCVGRVRGILTCGHGADAAIRMDGFGILYFPPDPTEHQTFQVTKRDVDPLVIGTPPFPDGGPDLGFLRLSDARAEALAQLITPICFRQHHAKWHAPDPTNTIFEFVSGVVGEWTEAPVLGPARITRPLNALLNVGKIMRVYELAGYDYFSFTPVPGPGFKLPNSYSRMSGGPLWRFFVRRVGEEYTLAEHRLIGVATDERHDGTMICHGGHSVFGLLAAEMQKKWPDLGSMSPPD